MRKLFGAALVGVCFVAASCSPTPAARAPAPGECRIDQASENPLHDPQRVLDMQVLTKKGRRGNALADTKQGLAIVLRPERGLTLEWLTHVLECDAHTPHGPDSTCPLSLPSAQVAVDSSQGHLIAYVRYKNSDSLKRAIELATQPAAPPATVPTASQTATLSPGQ